MAFLPFPAVNSYPVWQADAPRAKQRRQTMKGKENRPYSEREIWREGRREKKMFFIEPCGHHAAPRECCRKGEPFTMRFGGKELVYSYAVAALI